MLIYTMSDDEIFVQKLGRLSWLFISAWSCTKRWSDEHICIQFSRLCHSVTQLSHHVWSWIKDFDPWLSNLSCTIAYWNAVQDVTLFMYFVSGMPFFQPCLQLFTKQNDIYLAVIHHKIFNKWIYYTCRFIHDFVINWQRWTIFFFTQSIKSFFIFLLHLPRKKSLTSKGKNNVKGRL